MKECTGNSNNFLLRLCDQTGEHMKTLYASLDKEDFEKIIKILEVKEEDWN